MYSNRKTELKAGDIADREGNIFIAEGTLCKFGEIEITAQQGRVAVGFGWVGKDPWYIKNDTLVRLFRTEKAYKEWTKFSKIRGIDRFKNLPPMRISAKEFLALPEYSGSRPTGVKDGKMWRRLDGAHDPSCPTHLCAWMICRYNVYPDETYNQSNFRPIITC